MNTRSLGQVVQGVKRHCDIRNFFKKTTPQLEVILLQEHHMGTHDYLKKTSSMDFKDGLAFGMMLSTQQITIFVKWAHASLHQPNLHQS